MLSVLHLIQHMNEMRLPKLISFIVHKMINENSND